MVGSINNIGTSYGGYTTDAQISPRDKAAGVEVGDTSFEITEKRAGGGECETCKNRKYQDGSNENVSFKTAAHISPTAAGAAVRAHEGEHVANAYSKAAQDGGKVIQASVSIQTSICPECGRTYVSGGLTRTRIAYNQQPDKYEGKNVDLGA